KKSVPKTVPRLTFDDQDRPDGFTKTKKTPDKVTDEKAYLAVEGSGDKVQSGDTLVVQHVGQVYPDGDVFDESWSHGPATFSGGTGRLIKCWDDLLVDQQVGSRVILVCPAKYAYGEEGNDKSKGGDTLIFAIDLLAANCSTTGCGGQKRTSDEPGDRLNGEPPVPDKETYPAHRHRISRPVR